MEITYLYMQDNVLVCLSLSSIMSFKRTYSSSVTTKKLGKFHLSCRLKESLCNSSIKWHVDWFAAESFANADISNVILNRVLNFKGC